MPFRYIIALTAMLVPALAGAAVFTVNSTDDIPDFDPGDGVCATFITTICTLRAAIQEANALPGSDTIRLSGDQVYELTRTGDDDTALNGDLDITDDVSIAFILANGTRPVVNAAGIGGRAFQIVSGNVTLFGFDITGGDAIASNEETGGAIYVGFGAGIVQLSLLRFYNNTANFGGALSNDGPETTLSDSELYGNHVANDYATSGGSAIYNRGSLTIDHSLVRLNDGASGDSSSVIDNVPPFSGTPPALTLINSTVNSNDGFGIVSQDQSSLELRNATIAGNSGRGVYIAGSSGDFRMRNSVIAKNAVSDCLVSVSATLNLNRYNMDSDDTCELSSGSSNYPGVEPYLTPARSHGGFTAESWPLTISPLIDMGHPVIGATGCEADDQHYNSRPIDFDGDGTARCDVGAVEMSHDVIFFDPFEHL
ncbi:MAG: right-handed parallel beta-helix repeat-containing protein [Rudaea sp.]